MLLALWRSQSLPVEKVPDYFATFGDRHFNAPILIKSAQMLCVNFPFRDTRIAALGIARSYCYESPKPTEFGTAGSYWEAIGWKIDVSFRELDNRIHPKSHIGELRGLLPEKYSPLRANGDGLQSVYLAEVGRPFAAAPADVAR